MSELHSFEFLMVKDPHLQYGFRNNIRKHGWEHDIDSKLRQIISYAETNQVSNIIFTGDVFEKSRRKDWSLSQIQQNKKRLKWFKDKELNIYSNLGNHDQFDGREDIEGTAFNEMVELGLINYLGKEPSSFLVGNLYVKDSYVDIHGVDFHQSSDEVIYELERICSKPKQGPRIVVMHSNITDQPTRLTDFTYKQLSKFDIDIVCCGHWHLQPQGGAVQQVDGTWFLNPWNLTRVSRDYAVKLDEHHPGFIHASLVKVGSEFKYSFKEVALEVKPFSEAFNIDTINMLQELGKNGFNFFNEVDLDVGEDLDDDSKLLKSIAEANDISEKAIKIAKDLLE